MFFSSLRSLSLAHVCSPFVCQRVNGVRLLTHWSSPGHTKLVFFEDGAADGQYELYAIMESDDLDVTLDSVKGVLRLGVFCVPFFVRFVVGVFALVCVHVCFVGVQHELV